MLVIIAIVVLGTMFFLGLFTGIHFQERNLHARERRLAHGRRDLAERTEALDAYVGVSRIIASAQTHLERDALRRQDLPRIIVDEPQDLVS